MESSEFTFDQKYWKKIGQSKNTIVSNILFSKEEKGQNKSSITVKISVYSSNQIVLPMIIDETSVIILQLQ